MPITGTNFVGGWEEKDKPLYWDKKSRLLLKNPKGLEKIKSKWSRCPYNFELYFVRQKNAWKYLERGRVDREWVELNLDIQLPVHSDAITILYTQNIGVQKVPTTGWILAHRFSHAMRGTYGKMDPHYQRANNMLEMYMRYLAEALYDQSISDSKSTRSFELYHNIAHLIGTMKSAKNNKLVNYGEFFHELVAQFIVNGRCRFQLNKNLGDDIRQRSVELILEEMEDSMTSQIDILIGAQQGKIFVM